MQAEVRKVVTYQLPPPYRSGCGKRLVCYKVIVQGKAVDSALTRPRAARSLTRYIHARLRDYVSHR
jgi:hypothetical protein